MIALPDVNVLFALCWDHHPHHAAAQRWFQNAAPQGWATCHSTQIGFLRLSLNPVVVHAEVSCSTARSLLASFVEHPNHRFVKNSPSLTEVGFDSIESRIVGYRQISDAGLLYLARVEGMTLTTFDRGISAICPWPENVEILSAS